MWFRFNGLFDAFNPVRNIVDINTRSCLEVSILDVDCMALSERRHPGRHVSCPRTIFGQFLIDLFHEHLSLMMRASLGYHVSPRPVTIGSTNSKELGL